MTLTFTVYGKSEPQGSGKAILSKSTGRPMYKVDNPKLDAWRRDIATVARLEMSSACVSVIADGPVALIATFYLPRPKDLQRPKWAATDVPHTKKPDLDKLTRGLKDALRFVVYGDDSQVTDVSVRKRYCAAGDLPRAEITVTAVAVAPVPTKAPVRRPTLAGQENLYAETSIG